MASFSEERRSLLERFYDRKVMDRSVAGWRENLLELLEEIGTTGSSSLLAHVCSYVFDEDRRVAETASRVSETILSGLSPVQLARLDEVIRARWPWWPDGSQGWYKLSAGGWIRELEKGKFPREFLGLASMQVSGYVREAAVTRLAECQDGFEVPYLLIRLNDWVVPVREAARAAVERRLHPGYARHFIRNLALLLRLKDCGRADHGPLVASVEQLVRTADCRPDLLAGLASADRTVRRACFELASEATDHPLPELLERALNADDPMVRLWGARTARSRLDSIGFVHLMPLMNHDRFMPVRREALYGVVENSSELPRAALHAALLDSHASIREIARYYLSKLEGFDPREFYIEALRSGNAKTLGSVIAGLGETGRREDAALIQPWFTDSSTKVRRAAVRALGWLDADHYLGELLRALEDDRASVSRAARDALQTRLSHLDPQVLWRLFIQNHHPHVRRAVFKLIAGMGKWASLPYLIQACSDPDPLVTEQARTQLQRWLGKFNRTFVRPSSKELRDVGDALQVAESALDPETVKVLQSHLRVW